MLPRPSGAHPALLPLLAAGWLLASPQPLPAEPVAVCHAAPGRPEARRVLRVGPSAAALHLERHGDTLVRERELCNALDDDCDGRVDETFPWLGNPCFVGLGECAAEGVQECDPEDASATRCSAQPLEPPEPGRELTCTGGRDEDCDGLRDEEDPDCRFDIGRELPSRIDLPIAIDCCAVSGPACQLQDYCDVTAEPVAPCRTSSTGEVMSCLEFSSTPDFNACWSIFDPESPVMTILDLIAVVEDDSLVLDAGEVYADNGDRTPVLSRLRDRMLGVGAYLGDPAGIDLYAEAPGIDSWVVRLPVLECQSSGDYCAGEDRQEIVGALCFEIREITGPPDRVIRGRFLCPERDPFLWERCQLGPAFVD